MKKLYENSEIGFAVTWIIAYCVLSSVGDNLSANLGMEKVCTLPILVVLSIGAILFLKRNKLMEKYGLCRPSVSTSRMLFYVPLIILVTVNLWNGLYLDITPMETAFYVLSMFCVGFLEELIFRGFLFHGMLKTSLKSAMILSSVTFGIGHILNLINGSGAELLPNLLQVGYAMAAGFMFVMVYYRSKSLLPCIITHGLFNALSVFSNDVTLTVEKTIFTSIAIMIICGGYALYLAFAMQKDTEQLHLT